MKDFKYLDSGGFSKNTLNYKKDNIHIYIFKKKLTRKSSGGHQAKKEERKKPKPEEQEGMPQHQYCPPEKRRGDRNPECHEEQQKDVA
jgi:hypothetical protein